MIVLRNKRITCAYQNVGKQLTELLASKGVSIRVANWCTFAAWSSKTIGCTIDKAEVGVLVDGMPLKWGMTMIMQRLRAARHGTVFRSLAAGNRFIFMEIGMSITKFVEHFADLDDDPDGEAWRDYAVDLDTLLTELRQLDPSWVPSQPADPEMLKLGMKLYYDALFLHHHTDDYRGVDEELTEAQEKDLKSELILAANLQLAAYEQHRADGYVLTSFAWFGDHAFRRLLVRGTGRSRWPHKYFATWVWTKLVTKFALRLLLPYEMIRISKPLKPPIESHLEGGKPVRAPALFPRLVSEINEPRVQALISRFDLDDPDDHKRGAKNWMHYRERMHYITNLMRSCHEYAPLWEVGVFTHEVIADLLEGKLPVATDQSADRDCRERIGAATSLKSGSLP